MRSLAVSRVLSRAGSLTVSLFCSRSCALSLSAIILSHTHTYIQTSIQVPTTNKLCCSSPVVSPVAICWSGCLCA